MSTASVRIEATFELRGPDARQLAGEAAEMIDKLQQLSHRTGCECDVDVNLQSRPPPDTQVSQAS